MVGRKPAPPWYGSLDSYEDGEYSVASQTGTCQYRPRLLSKWLDQPSYWRINACFSAVVKPASPAARYCCHTALAAQKLYSCAQSPASGLTPSVRGLANWPG